MFLRKHRRRWPKHARGEYLANWLVGLMVVAIFVFFTVKVAQVALG